MLKTAAIFVPVIAVAGYFLYCQNEMEAIAQLIHVFNPSNPHDVAVDVCNSNATESGGLDQRLDEYPGAPVVKTVTLSPMLDSIYKNDQELNNSEAKSMDAAFHEFLTDPTSTFLFASRRLQEFDYSIAGCYREGTYNGTAEEPACNGVQPVRLGLIEFYLAVIVKAGFTETPNFNVKDLQDLYLGKSVRWCNSGERECHTWANMIVPKRELGAGYELLSALNVSPSQYGMRKVIEEDNFQNIIKTVAADSETVGVIPYYPSLFNNTSGEVQLAMVNGITIDECAANIHEAYRLTFPVYLYLNANSLKESNPSVNKRLKGIVKKVIDYGFSVFGLLNHHHVGFIVSSHEAYICRKTRSFGIIVKPLEEPCDYFLCCNQGKARDVLIEGTEAGFFFDTYAAFFDSECPSCYNSDLTEDIPQSRACEINEPVCSALVDNIVQGTVQELTISVCFRCTLNPEPDEQACIDSFIYYDVSVNCKEPESVYESHQAFTSELVNPCREPSRIVGCFAPRMDLAKLQSSCGLPVHASPTI